MPTPAPSVPPFVLSRSSAPPTGRPSHTPGTSEEVTIEVQGIGFEITLSELYATLGLHTAEVQCEFRSNFVGTNMGKPPGVLQRKLQRWRPDLAALLETIPVR
jgi:hypothetical protein